MFVGESGRRSHSISDVSCFLLTLATLAPPDEPLLSVVKGIRGHTRTHPRAHKFLANGSTLGVRLFDDDRPCRPSLCRLITPDGRAGRTLFRALPRGDDAAMIRRQTRGESRRDSARASQFIINFLKVGHHPIARYYRWREITMAATNEAFSEPAVNPRHSMKSRDDALASRLTRRESFEADLNSPLETGAPLLNASYATLVGPCLRERPRSTAKYARQPCAVRGLRDYSVNSINASPEICFDPARCGRIGHGNGLRSRLHSREIAILFSVSGLRGGRPACEIAYE